MASIDFQTVLDEISDEVQPIIGEGEVASYIPELACIPSNKFGIALLTCDGQMFSVGDSAERFSIQSISKVLSLALAIQQVGPSLWKRVGREPSGSAFNSLVQLESENGIPRNPFINAGALVVTDVILTELEEATQTVLNFVRRASGVDTIEFDDAVASSEAETGFRNIALANFVRSFGNLDNNPADVLAAYFKHCSIAMSCEELAQAFMFLARNGTGFTGEELLSAERTKYINALMLTCGTYDAVGDFAYRVGLPCKSGVGGGLVAVMPREFVVCTWSPGLDKRGNSLVGGHALDLLTTKTGISVF